VAEQIRQKLGDPTVLVNNAGVGHDGTILEEPEAKIRQTFEVNTISHFLMVREFLPSMIRQNHGHVITIASMASFVALGEMVDYCCSKASALAFHEGLTQELRYWYQAKKVRTRYEATFDLTSVVLTEWKCHPPTVGSYAYDSAVDRGGKPIQATRDDAPGGF
jgi:NADP-dependent 3-hydroxy acid dehydrogenase YdfG